MYFYRLFFGIGHCLVKVTKYKIKNEIIIYFSFFLLNEQYCNIIIIMVNNSIHIIFADGTFVSVFGRD